MLTEPSSSIHLADEASEYWFAEGCFILEWMNCDAEPAVSVARARVLPGTSTKWHRLRGVTERYVILAGHGVVQVEGLAPCRVGPGAMVVIAPGDAQCIRNDGAMDLVFMVVCTPRFVPDCYQPANDMDEPSA